MCSRQDRIRQVLLAARETIFYRQRLKTADLDDPEEALARLPPLELRDLFDRPLAFHNPCAPRPALRRVFYPAGKAPSIVVLMPGFRQAAGVRVSGCGWNWLLPRFRPSAVAAPVARLKELAQSVMAGEIPPPLLQHAVIAFTGVRHGLLSEEDRDLFWRAFRVPVFEQLLGLGGELLAWECEAHDGLHTVAENVVVESSRSELVLTSLDCLGMPALRLASGFTAALDRRPCACGHGALRLAGISHKSEARMALVARAG
jgi:hypothetical protein